MIAILPNWHPMLVHFTIGLLGTSVVFYFASALLAKDHKWKQQWQHMANWSLWSGCLVTIGTVFAGWYAYNTVAHDEASHAAMTLHRDWALASASLFLILGLAAVNIAKNNKTPRYLFLSVTVIAGSTLLVTGFLGAEAVYRHGLGVMSLPTVEADDHHHLDTSPHDQDNSSAPQHHETTYESEPHHLDELMMPNIDVKSDIEMDEHSRTAETDPTTPNAHQH
jgi:uncharacterized membrane protein